MARTATKRAKQERRGLEVLATVRLVAAAIAIPLLPFLFQHHYFVLVFLRPSQLVLLGGGYLARQGRVALWTVILAAIPMQVLAVWLYFAIGRAWAKEIRRDDDLPMAATRFLGAAQIKALRKAMRARATQVIFLSRFAIVPVGLIATAAGSSNVSPKRYTVTDATAAALATTLSIAAGYLLGVAKDTAGPWLAVVGALSLAAITTVVTLYLRRIK